MKKAILALVFMFVMGMTSISLANDGWLCFDEKGKFCAEFFNLDREWLAMSHTDSFTDIKTIAVVKFENGSQRLWKKHGRKGVLGAKKIFLDLECSTNKENGEIIRNLYWTQDVFESSLGKKLQLLGFMVAIGSGAMGGPAFAQRGKGIEDAKAQMEKMEIKIDYRFDSGEVINAQWKIRSRMLSRNIFQIYSSIPYYVLEKIVSGNYQKLALRGDFLSTQRTAFFDLKQSKTAIEKLLAVCPKLKK